MKPGALSRRIGITTTVPIEVIYASRRIPVDLNNLFLSREDAPECIEEAEAAGFPRNFCAWIKGIYGALKREGDIGAVVAVTQGDCSNTHALMEVLQVEGITVIPFAYPYDRDRVLFRSQLERMMEAFGVEEEEVRSAVDELDRVRSLALRLDEITWKEGSVTGRENHLALVSCSDMEGDPSSFARKLEGMMEQAREREPWRGVRLGYVGVPPLASEIYDYLEELGARVMYNEVQRQFALPYEGVEWWEKYLFYTYPYSFQYRLQDIATEVKRRGLQGIIHYVQSFCFRQVEDLILRRSVGVPVLTVEMDRGLRLDARTRMRLENFVSILKRL